MTNKNNLEDFNLVESYLRMLDRILLYNCVAHSMPKEMINDAVELWQKIITKNIDSESSKRTNFLESPEGRIVKMTGLPDGEEYRLNCLKQMNIAKAIVDVNFKLSDDQNDKNTFV